MQGFNRLAILPILHRNLIQFEAMPNRKKVLFAAKYQDTFTALLQDNHVYTWSM